MKKCKKCKLVIKPKEGKPLTDDDIFCSKCKWIKCPNCDVKFIIRDKYPTCFDCKSKQ